MAGHREVLARRLKEMGHTHRSISLAMGWKSPASAGHKLTGRTDWASGELAKMCELGGLSIVRLSELSDDMPGFHRRLGIAEASEILDKVSDVEFHSLMVILRSISSRL